MAAKPTQADAARLFDQHAGALYRFASRLMGPGADAEDAVHNVLVSYLDGGGYDASRGPLRVYLYGAVRNQARKLRRIDNDELAETMQAGGVPTDARLAVEQAVASALERLPWTQREVLLLAHYEELSLKDIALTLNLELAAVKSRLHRARENMRVALGEWKGARQ